MAENSKVKTVMVNAGGGISYPENFISANNIAQTSGATFTGDILLGDYTSASTTIQPNKIIVSSFPSMEGSGLSSVDCFTEITGQSLSVCNGVSKWFRSFVVDTSGGSQLSLIGDRYCGGMNFTVKENIYSYDGEGSIATLQFNSVGNAAPLNDYESDNILINSGITFKNGTVSNNKQYEVDPYGMSFTFNNDAEAFAGITQAPIYGFTSTDLSSNTNKDKFVYTAKGVEDRLASVSSSVDLSNYVTKSELEVNLYKDNNTGITLGSGVSKSSGPYGQYYANADGTILTAKTFGYDIGIIKNIWSSDKNNALNQIDHLIKPDGSNYYGVVGISTDSFIIKPTVDAGINEDGSLPTYEFSLETKLTATSGISLDTFYGDINIEAATRDIGTVTIKGANVIIGDENKESSVVELRAADNIKMGTYFTAPVYTENDDSTYTKTNKTVALRVVERNGAYTIVIE